MNSSTLLRLASVLAATAGLASVTHAQSVIYREVFGRTGTDVSLSTFSWSAYSGATATDRSASAAFFSVTAEVGGSFSNANSLAAVNSGAASSVTTGRTLLGNGLSGVFIAYTTEYVVDRDAFSVTSFSWDQRDNNNAQLGVAVQIGGAWYASNTASFTPATSPAVWGASLLDFTTATWSTLTLTPGTALSVGSTTTLPSGNITAFGVYAPTARGANAARIDGFTINATLAAVPEPSAFAALAGVAGLGAAALRRRRR